MLDSLYGKTYEGGLITYLNTSNGSGFVASPEDVSPLLTIWGCNNTTILEQIIIFNDPVNGRPVYDYIPLATAETIGSGKANTQVIVDKCLISAATFSDTYIVNGYDDWYMPSKDEMIEVSKNLPGIDTLAATYWTSTQENVTANAKVHVISTADHTSSLHSKTSIDGLGLRAIRNF